MSSAARAAIAIGVVLPILALTGTLFDKVSGSVAPSFLNLFATNLFIVYLYGTVPALLGSATHTYLSQVRRLRSSRYARVQSVAYGCAIGIAGGIVLGLILCLRAFAFVPEIVLATTLWGGFAGVLYGSLCGPAEPTTVQRAQPS